MPSMQIGVDPAKSVFEVALSPVPGQVRARRRLSRPAFTTFFAQLPPAEVLLEACGSAHHWGRELQRLGHHLTLLHPRDVTRYRDGHRTDRADAKAPWPSPTHSPASAGESGATSGRSTGARRARGEPHRRAAPGS